MLSAKEYTRDPDSYTATLILDAEYKYDVFGNRLEQDVTQSGTTTVTRYAYDGWDPDKGPAIGTENFDVWADLTVVSGSQQLQTRYIRADAVDQIFARVGWSGTTATPAWLLTDRLGSVRQVTDATGAVIDTITYDGWGNATQSAPANGGRYLWTGRETDSATGLEYDRARYYDPTTGRFTSQDPLGFLPGDANKYRYAGNDSTNFTDPSGNWDSMSFSLERIIAQPGNALAGIGQVGLGVPGIGGLANLGVAVQPPAAFRPPRPPRPQAAPPGPAGQPPGGLPPAGLGVGWVWPWNPNADWTDWRPLAFLSDIGRMPFAPQQGGETPGFFDFNYGWAIPGFFTGAGGVSFPINSVGVRIGDGPPTSFPILDTFLPGVHPYVGISTPGMSVTWAPGQEVQRGLSVAGGGFIPLGEDIPVGIGGRAGIQVPLQAQPGVPQRQWFGEIGIGSPGWIVGGWWTF
jgi:RHS repeat-associated protein